MSAAPEETKTVPPSESKEGAKAPKDAKKAAKEQAKEQAKAKPARAAEKRPMSPPPEARHRSLLVKKYTDGNVFAGEVADSLPSGHGTMLFRSSGNRYEGEWRRGARSGNGRLTCANGDVYEGCFSEDKKEGVGMLTTAEHGVYRGEWEDDTQEGKGVHIWKDGAEYRGFWRNGTYNGLGAYKHGGRDAGDVYVGEFRDGRKHGHGTLTQSNGNSYSGAWEMGRKHGHGIAISRDGASKEAQHWISGTLVESAEAASVDAVPSSLSGCVESVGAAVRAAEAAQAALEDINLTAEAAAAAASRAAGHSDAADAARAEAEGTVLRHGLRISLVAAHGELFSAKPNGEIQANRYRLTPYEMLTMEGEGSEFSLKTTSDGKYVCWDREGVLAARMRAVAGERERFTVEIHDGKLALLAGGRYVTAAPDGTVVARDLEVHPQALWGLVVRSEEWDDPFETRRPVLDAEVLATKRAADELRQKENELREREAAMASERQAVLQREAEIQEREAEAQRREAALQERTQEVAQIEQTTRARAEDAKQRDAAAALEKETDAEVESQLQAAERASVTAAFGRYDVMQTGRLPQASVAAILQDLRVPEPRAAARRLLAEGHPASTADITLQEFVAAYSRLFSRPAAPAMPTTTTTPPATVGMTADEIEALRTAFDGQEDAESGWIDMTGVRLALSEVGVGVSASAARQFLRGIGRLHGPFGSRVNFGDVLRIYSDAKAKALPPAAPQPQSSLSQQQQQQQQQAGKPDLEQRWLTSSFDVHNRRNGGLGLLPFELLATVLNDAGDSAKVFYAGIQRHLQEHASTAEAFTLDQLLRAYAWAGAQPSVANSLEPVGDRFALEKLRRTFEVFELDAEGRLKLKARRGAPEEEQQPQEAAKPETTNVSAEELAAMAEREAAVQAREDAVKEREAAVQEREDALKEKERQLARQKATLDARERRNQQHEHELRQKQRELEDLAAMQGSGQPMDELLQDRLRGLQQELQEKEREIERLRRMIDELRQNPDAAVGSGSSGEEDPRTAAMVRSLEERVERLMREYANVTQQNKKLVAENAELRDLLRACRERCEELERQLEELRGGRERPTTAPRSRGKRTGGGYVLESQQAQTAAGRRARSASRRR